MVFMKALYMDLIHFVLCTCAFIPVWVFRVLYWQLRFDKTTMHPKERGAIEFFWTVVPTRTVTIMCILNVQCMSLDPLEIPKVLIKVVGRQ